MSSSSPNKRYIPPSRRRDKPQLSCTFCRSRKLKCDRNQPCQNCCKRDNAWSCTYVPFEPRNAHSHGSLVVPGNQGADPSDTTDKSRAQFNLATRSPSTAGVSSVGSFDGQSRLSESDEPPGRVDLRNTETIHVERAHWATPLSQAIGYSDSLQPPRDSSFSDGRPTIDTSPHGPDLLYGVNKAISYDEVLASLPPRNVVDRLLSWFFVSVDLAPVVLHSGTFAKEYEKFWERPLATSVIWISLLFSLMSLGAHLNNIKGDGSLGLPENSQEMSFRFREKAAQCLILGEYTKPKRNTVEALILYLAAETTRSPGMPFSLHLIFGIIVRIAMRMGYHRDSSSYSSISVFQAEMRRRVWTWIRMTDILISSQLGMPRFVAEGVDDTATPLNLLDDDFDEDIASLPNPRSDLESTSISYLVQKSKLIEMLGRIITTVNCRTPITSNRTMELDEQLQEVHQSLPSWLRIKARTSFITDAPDLLLRRIAVDVAYRRAQCILHRRSFYSLSTDPCYHYSRRVCVEAAMRILGHQSSLYEDAQPGGCLHQERWKMTWHYTNDFLLGAVIIYLALRSMLRGQQDEQDPSASYDREALMKAINGSFEIWVKSSATSNEAADASHILKLMLENLGATADAATMSQHMGSANTTNSILLPSLDVSSLPTARFPINYDILVDPFPSTFEMIENGMNAPIDLTWDLWNSTGLT